MFSCSFFFRVVSVLALALATGLAGAVTRIEIQHSLSSDRSTWLSALVSRFNAGQSEVEIRLRAGADDGKASLLLREVSAPPAPGTYQPLHQLVDVNDLAGKLLPELAASVSDARGRVQALPIALATTVLFYNKAAFRAAGLDPETPPRTWSEVQQAADKLFDAGSSCPFSTSRPAEVLVEQLSAWHGAPIFAQGRTTAFNGLLQVRHLALMSSWYKSRFFATFGRQDEADAHFAAGECGLLTSESNLYPYFVAAGLDVGVASLPVHEGLDASPRFTLVDGLALWVRPTRSKAEVRAAATFVQYLLQPEAQLALAREGGFLPLGPAAVAAVSQQDGEESPQQPIALAQIKGGGMAQLARMPQLRRVIDEELEAVWANRKPAKAALDAAVGRASGVARRPRA